MKNVKEFEIDLTTSNDCNLVLDVLKNTTIIGELYSYYYDGEEHMTCTMYADDEQTKDLLEKFPVFENIFADEYELDDDCVQTLNETKKATIDDIYELKSVYEKLEALHERYTLVKE